jgi:hypothetical protein
VRHSYTSTFVEVIAGECSKARGALTAPVPWMLFKKSTITGIFMASLESPFLQRRCQNSTGV